MRRFAASGYRRLMEAAFPCRQGIFSFSTYL